MKISGVRTHYLQAQLDRPFGWSLEWADRRSALLVEIGTDEGITGWGEAGVPGHKATAAVISEILKPLLIGQDPFDREVLWERMYAKTRDYGQKGIPIDAVSGIDIALWDVMGKALGLPVHKLLGGAMRDQVMAYATGLYYKESPRLMEELVQEALDYVKEGFRAVKMKIGGLPLAQDLANVRAVREAIGPEVLLMVDANHAYNTMTAIQVGRELEKCQIFWFEEPVIPEDLQGYLEVKEALDIPIAGGECEYTRFGFRDLISRRAVDIVQPDTCRVGGLSEAKKIAALSSAWGIPYFPHVWGTPVAMAAALHLMATLPEVPLCRNPLPFHQTPALEFDRTPHPIREELTTQPFSLEGGWVRIPTSPGLGVEVREEVLAKYRLTT
jgi:D-galactarolactone cycloisomerase